MPFLSTLTLALAATPLACLCSEKVLGTITTPPNAGPSPGYAELIKRADPNQPLTEYFYPYSAVPYQVNPYQVGRGPQTGYNQCNSTTEGPNSQCQTLILNSLKDFCLWGSPTKNGIVGNIEAETVVYCAQPGHGTRLIAGGSITAAQFIKTSAYIQVTGLLDQRGVGLNPDDQGGELDPHGADNEGNPLGGLVYSTALPGGSNKTYIQSQSWTNFMGSNMFCIKVCFPGQDKPNYCENRYDIIGCNYNMPASYQPNEFTSCDGELQDVVGTYVQNGATLTWDQNSGGDPPYQPRIPKTSNCQTFASTDLYPAATTSSSSSLATSISTSASGSLASGMSSRATGASTGTSATASSTSTSGASQVVANLGILSTLGALVFWI